MDARGLPDGAGIVSHIVNSYGILLQENLGPKKSEASR